MISFFGEKYPYLETNLYPIGNRKCVFSVLFILPYPIGYILNDLSLKVSYTALFE